MPVKIPRPASELEVRFLMCLRAYDLQARFRKEYRFDPTRRWRFDFAEIELMIGVELEGGIFSKRNMGHNTGRGIKQDMEKSNAAQALGWRVFRFDIDQVKSGYAIDFIIKVLAQESR